jgi:hypothetical protein
MDRRGLGWASWDWKSGFYFWDRSTNGPAPGMRERITGPVVGHASWHAYRAAVLD